MIDSPRHSGNVDIQMIVLRHAIKNAAEKSRSAYNIQITPATISAQIRDNDASTIPWIKATTVLDLSGRQYFIQDSPKLYVEELASSLQWAPIALIDIRREDVTLENLKAKLDHFKTDDVFSPSFMPEILLITEVCSTTIPDDVAAFLSSEGCNHLHVASPGSISYGEGPYFYSSRGLFAAWRLYADPGEAFIAATIPSQEDSSRYSTLTASASGAHTLSLAVPSRLMYKPTAEKPLAGMRVGIKDVFDLKGIHTGNGNRAFAQCYPPANHSAEFIDVMIKQGAIIVGKTKTVEFAGEQEVVADWVDYSYPFNPRGDYYLGATGSSTGSAAAIASYQWLDIALGTDAGGSVRDPAIACGIYGFRPTHDGMQEPGSLIPCPTFQTTGYFARSLKEMLTFGKFWRDWKSTINKACPPLKRYSSTLINDFPEAHLIVKEFVSALSKHLQAKVIHTSIEDHWKSHRPPSNSKPFFEYFRKTFIDTLTHDYYNMTSDFRKDYKVKFKEKPYISPPTQWIWGHGSSVTPIRRKQAQAEIETHNKLFLSHIIHDQDPEASTLMIVPRFYKRHRDDSLPVAREREYYGFDSNLHASLSGVPNIVVPIGQAKYWSNITEKFELLPISASIISAKGTDLALIEMLLEFLPSYGINTSVLTGKTAFEVENG
ncbi:hypothetical protein V501_06686 [Pseudogymnoascus sp. VKM F-4519 (FW-2642)]|nr:hypothetical protein V501_06686 [Pseudogymnoascus sp. VKM F-4519 (FW-2642)]